MKVRIRFAKNGAMKFVGHLDMMRYFQRAIRRVDLDVKYSSGFSPHMLMSFASPLGVGLESSGEYFDLELNSSPEPADAIARLNRTMAEGVEVLDYVILPEGAQNAMSAVAAADYALCFREGYRDEALTDARITAGIEAFYTATQEIVITKKTKKSERTLDIKPLIYRFSYEGEGRFFLRLSAGSVENLKPELVMEHFFRALDLPYSKFCFHIRRLDLFYRDETGAFRGLSDVQEGEENA